MTDKEAQRRADLFIKRTRKTRALSKKANKKSWKLLKGMEDSHWDIYTECLLQLNLDTIPNFDIDRARAGLRYMKYGDNNDT